MWSEKKVEIFKKVKSILLREDTVVPYDEAKPFILICDASEYGLESVLMHIGLFEDEFKKAILKNGGQILKKLNSYF
jgi:hypothetical protein